MKDLGRFAGITFIAFILLGLLLMALNSCAEHRMAQHREKWELFSIQGETSYLDCEGQPGTHPWYIENSGQEWFMGCMK